MYIHKYTKEHDPNTGENIWYGDLHCTGATFIARVKGSGNNATFEITIPGRSTIKVTGEWEVMELFEIMKLITPKI